MAQDLKKTRIKFAEFLGIQGGLLGIVLAYFVSSSSNHSLRTLVAASITLFVIGSVFTYVNLQSETIREGPIERFIYSAFTWVLSVGFTLLIATVASVFLTGVGFYLTFIALFIFVFLSLDIRLLQDPLGRRLWEYIRGKLGKKRASDNRDEEELVPMRA